MNPAFSTRYLLAVLLIAWTALVTGCGKKDDSITQAEKKDAAKGVAAPSIAETKAIAEEGFIYGLPIVMNYAVMYEYAVDRNSGQFKAPFNEINNEARVFTYKDTAIVTPNSDTPYSIVWMDLRAELLAGHAVGRHVGRIARPLRCISPISTSRATSAACTVAGGHPARDPDGPVDSDIDQRQGDEGLV